MKMIPTPIAVAASSFPAYVHNCLRNKACEPNFSAPFPAVSTVEFYIDFGTTQPVSIEFNLIDFCNGNALEQIFPGDYVISTTPEGNWYGVFKTFNNPITPVTTFVVHARAVVIGGTGEKTFFSEMLIVEPCGPLMKVKSCHPQAATLTGFDLNGIYYGLPQGSFLGDDSVRYFHIAYVRQGKVRELSNKATFKSSLYFNFRTTIEKIFQAECELVPQWFKNILLAIYSRGAVSFDDGPTFIVSDLNFEPINDDDLTWKPFAQLKETFRLYYGCDDGRCEECCSPTMISADAVPGDFGPSGSSGGGPGGGSGSGSGSIPGGSVSGSDPGASASDPGPSASDPGPEFPLGLRMKFTPEGYADFSGTSLGIWNAMFNTTIRADAPFNLVTLLPATNEIVLSGPTEITVLEPNAMAGALVLLEFHDDGGLVKEIGDACFQNCSNLTTVVFPQNLINDLRAFDQCTSLVSVTEPLLVTSSDSSFEGCTALTTVNFPSLVNIGNSCFKNCTNLANVTVQAATNIQGFAFRECHGLQNLDIRGSSPIGSTTGNDFIFFFTAGATVTVTVAASAVGDGDLADLAVSNTVTIIPV